MNKKILLFFLLILLSGCGKKTIITEEQKTESEKTQAPLSQSANTVATSSKIQNPNIPEDPNSAKTVHGKNENQNIKGSCPVIEKSSICTEYVGEFWTKEQMDSNCKSFGTVSSTEACDNDFIGGCNIASGTANENTIWYYGRGKAGISETALKNLEKLCNRNPKAKWISK